MNGKITMAHGGGGTASNRLIREIFLKHFGTNDTPDAAVLNFPEKGKLAFTTDSFVVSPLFFNGGNIGKLAVCGTVNDLTCVGAKPLYLSCGFIIEEGFEIAQLDQIVKSMAETALTAEVKVVCGDTKVVQRGACEGVYINTAGVGFVQDGTNILPQNAKAGDVVILSGYPGEHAAAIVTARNELGISGDLSSDCAPLNKMIQNLYGLVELHVLRDPTRGGVAASLNEIAKDSNVGIELDELSIVVPLGVQAVCSLLGYDPLYMANEGKMIIVLPQDDANRALDLLRSTKEGQHAAIIGKIVAEHEGKVVLNTESGGRRLIDMPFGEQLPRIC